MSKELREFRTFVLRHVYIDQLNERSIDAGVLLEEIDRLLAQKQEPGPRSICEECAEYRKDCICKGEPEPTDAIRTENERLKAEIRALNFNVDEALEIAEARGALVALDELESYLLDLKSGGPYSDREKFGIAIAAACIPVFRAKYAEGEK